MIFLHKPGQITIGESGIPLSNAFDDVVTEVDRGRYDLEFKLPIEYTKGIEFKPFSVLAAHTPNGLQGFILQHIEKKQTYIQVFATHVFFRLRSYEIRSLHIYGSTSDILTSFRQTVDGGQTPFTFSSNIDKRFSIEVKDKNAMDVLADGEESIIGKSGGSLLRNNYNVVLNHRTGTDRDLIIANRKNVKDISIKISNENVATRLFLKKLIKPEELIPKENGKGYVNNPTIYPPSGSPRGSLRIRLYDSWAGNRPLITSEPGAFDIYDSNGYRIFYNVQTGSIDSKQKAEERHQKNIEDLSKEQERKPELQERREELQTRISELAQKVKDAQAAYNYSSTEENLKKLRAAQKSLKNSEDSFDNNRESILRNNAKIAELQNAIANYKAVIPGERHLINALPPGTYTITQTKTTKDHLTEKRPKVITIQNGQTTTVDYDNTSRESEEDQRMWYYASVKSPLFNEYPYPLERSIEVKDENIQSNEQLKAYGETLFSKDHIDLPEEETTVLTTAEVLESNLKINDSCQILYSDYGIYKRVPVVGYQYRPMTKTYKEVTVGKKGVNFKGEITGKVNKTITDLEQFLGGEIKNETTGMHLAFDSVWNKLEAEFMERFKDMDSSIVSGLEKLDEETKHKVHETIHLLLTTAEENIETTEKLIEDLSEELGTTSENAEKIKEELNKFKNEQDSLKTRVSVVEQKAESISSAVYDENGASKIEQMAGQITQMVTGEEFSSYISQTAEHLLLYAKLTDIQGLVRFTDLKNTSQTIINGGTIINNTIKTESLQAEIVKAKHLVVDQLLINKLTAGDMMVDAILAQEAFITKLLAKEAFIKKLQSIEINADQITAGVIQSSMGNFRLYLQESNSTPVMKLGQNVISLTSPEQLSSRYLIMTYDKSSGGSYWGSQNGGIWFGMHKNRPGITTDHLWLLKIGDDETYDKYAGTRFRCLTKAVFEQETHFESNTNFYKKPLFKSGIEVESNSQISGHLNIGTIRQPKDLKVYGDFFFKNRWIYQNSLPRANKITKAIKTGYFTLTPSDLGISTIKEIVLTVEYRGTPLYASIQPSGSNYTVYIRTADGSVPPDQSITIHCIYTGA